MADITVPKGDYGYNLAFTVQDDDGTAYNLSGYTVTIKVWAKGMSAYPFVEEACGITNEAAGTCYYTVQDGDFDAEGESFIELELTKEGVVESTRNYTLYVESSP